VRRALAGVVVGIEDLQREAVFLQALVTRVSVADTCRERTADLMQSVRRTIARFEDAVRALDPRRRDHSVVRDLSRTLSNLAQVASRLATAGGVPTPRTVSADGHLIRTATSA
jgi:hypothetical protein